MTRTISQSNRFHALIGQHRFDKEDKQAIVLQFTSGRETSSTKMSIDEMAQAIEHLEGVEQGSVKKMQAKIINIFRDIIDLPNPTKLEQAQWDMLNKHIQRTAKKPLHKLTYAELPDVVTSMERWRDTALLKGVNEIMGVAPRKVGRPRKQPLNAV